MTLTVIGAGFGRTGTKSLKDALEQLGLGPCYHMIEVLQNPGFAEHWLRADAGAAMDWDAVFGGYASTTDWPACDHWRALADHYPDAKVILTTRDPEGWFASTQNTIFSSLNTRLAGDGSAIGQLMRGIGARHFGGAFDDRARCIAAFQRHNDAVRRGIAPDRLLEFDVREGWERLCRFLRVAVPATAFPSTNTTEEFRASVAQRLAGLRRGALEVPPK
ncbi:MAG TPA: sulfotransferase [Acetobacteraceae bacterium]|nr:sulfotransferase [Acetobacteraceae bacterium]